MSKHLKEVGCIIKNNKSDYNKPNVWVKFAKIAQETKGYNLGQGFPDWNPPDFYFDILNNQLKNENNPEKLNHQYTRAFGSMNLVNSIISNYNNYYNYTNLYNKSNTLNANNILVSTGGAGALYNTITSLVNPGDEVVIIEPFYDSYYPVAKYSGAIVKGVSLIPPKFRNIEEYKNMLINDTYEVSKELSSYNKEDSASGIVYNKRIKTTLKDKWEFDFPNFYNSLNDQTKVVIINSPNNPTGKIFTEEELEEIASMIIKKAPNAYIISDEVYEHLYYDNFTSFPRLANLKNKDLNQEIWKRIITISSAGKIFSATGIRIGWIIANENTINKIFVIHQYNSFCLYDPLQNLIAECLNKANNKYRGFDNYYEWLRDYYNKSRTYMFECLVNNTHVFNNAYYKLKYWLPEGGYFIIGDIKESECYKTNNNKISKLNTAYNNDNNSNTDNILKNNDIYSLDLAYNKKLITIPMSCFYTPDNLDYSENYIRLAYCKKLESIDNAFKNTI